MINRQLELGLDNRPVCQSDNRRRRRTGRANWWFERMRGLVEGAQEWEPSVPKAQNAVTPMPQSETLESGIPEWASQPGPALSSETPPSSTGPRWKFVRLRTIEGE